MAITEIITPFLKQDAVTKTAFNSIIKPLLSSIVKVAPGAKMQVVGRMISKNNINVEEDGWELVRSKFGWQYLV